MDRCVASEVEIGKTAAENAISAVLETIFKEVATGRTVQLGGGTFGRR
jgi:DNA-binding protein HU-beta